jgi:hypothetical protein
MRGKVGDWAYRARFDASGVPQTKGKEAPAAQALSAAEIMQRAIDAAGGEAWLNPKTLVMSGRAVFYGPAGAEPRSTTDDYRMWRVFDPSRTAAHGAEGKVLIRAKDRDRTLFEAGYDGTTTWTERGITPKAEADAFWASNFGFGIIRHAGKPGFKLERVGDDDHLGRPIYKLRLTDPAGSATLFGIDQQNFTIRTMEFMTPRGWHKRTYDDFVELQNPRWMQARKVTLFYNGVRQNEVHWSDVQVNVPVDDKLFVYSPRR